MVARRREKVAARGMAEPVGGEAVAPGPVEDDGAPSLEGELGANPDAGVELEGPLAGAGAGAGAFLGAGEEEPLTTSTLSFWPLLQWPEKVHEK